jgi:hypothetical protein
MKNFRSKFLAGLFIILLFLGLGYYFRNDVALFWRSSSNLLQPCQKPITYSIAELDPRFGLTEAELLDNIKKAEKIWESPINKSLFEYSPARDLKISLIYDYRQKATDSLRKMGIVIEDNQVTYDTLKAKYDSLIVSYKKQKAQLDVLVAAYNADKSVYEKDVNHWNGRGGAPKAEYNTLEQQRVDLNNQVAEINQAKNTLNELVDVINSTETVLNKLVGTLNLNVDKYNAVGSSTGEVFNEGEYVSDASGTAINIYQFDDANQLVRVLAHELGHALGLGHLNNPKAIMYYRNEGLNEKLTADDLAALKKMCEIK